MSHINTPEAWKKWLTDSQNRQQYDLMARRCVRENLSFFVDRFVGTGGPVTTAALAEIVKHHPTIFSDQLSHLAFF